MSPMDTNTPLRNSGEMEWMLLKISDFFEQFSSLATRAPSIKYNTCSGQITEIIRNGMKNIKAKYGLATLCIGGGEASAMIVKSIN